MGLFDIFKKKVGKGPLGLNDQLRARLAELGDSGHALRHTVHYAYPFGDQDSVEYGGVEAWLAAQNFDAKPAVADGGIVFEHQTSVSGEGFDTLTNELRDWLKSQGWNYDGWECEVVKDN